MTQVPGAADAGPRRLLLVDAQTAPRRALAGQLAAHLGGGAGAGRSPAICEALSVEAALEQTTANRPPPWDAALISAADDGAARGAVARLRAAGARLPVLVMLPPGDGRGPWPAGVTRTDRPARLATLVAWLHALPAAAASAAHGAAAADGFALGPYLCDPAGRTLTERASGTVIALTEKEAAILACLHDSAVPMGREALLAGIWGYGDGVTTHTLETHIHRLRRKIEPDPRQPSLLVTDGGGYRLGG